MQETVAVTLANGQHWQASLRAVDAALSRYHSVPVAELRRAALKALENRTAEPHSAPESRIACLVILASQPSDMLTMADVAERLDLRVETVRQYRARGWLPEPDDMDRRSPLWQPETIQAWQEQRPGQGWRAKGS